VRTYLATWLRWLAEWLSADPRQLTTYTLVGALAEALVASAHQVTDLRGVIAAQTKRHDDLAVTLEIVNRQFAEFMGNDYLVRVPKDAVWKRAQALCAFQNHKYPERSGEAKRHAVYGELLQEMDDQKLPRRNKRDVARAIEAAL
jgi:hypothetical protein